MPVAIKNLTPIFDSRGFLMEILRNDDKLFRKFGQAYITSCKKGVAKGWHLHKKQYDNFVCVSGKALVVTIEAGVVKRHIIAAPTRTSKPQLVQIPPGVWHGFTALSKNATILNIPTHSYNYKNPDEYRLPWNSSKIRFSWPSFVRRGG